jgi:hypothetical protein
MVASKKLNWLLLEDAAAALAWASFRLDSARSFFCLFDKVPPNPRIFRFFLVVPSGRCDFGLSALLCFSFFRVLSKFLGCSPEGFTAGPREGRCRGKSDPSLKDRCKVGISVYLGLLLFLGGACSFAFLAWASKATRTDLMAEAFPAFLKTSNPAPSSLVVLD